MAKPDKIYVNIPVHGWQQFPAGMPMDQVKRAAKKLHATATTKPGKKSTALRNILTGATKALGK